jgi:hypothetical protein
MLFDILIADDHAKLPARRYQQKRELKDECGVPRRPGAQRIQVESFRERLVLEQADGRIGDVQRVSAPFLLH